MPTLFKETSLPGVLLIEPQTFTDHRGFFLETYQARRYSEAGLLKPFVQDNHSHSLRHTVRGLHYQLRRPQGKLILCVQGEILDVAVDIRRGSPTFGRSVAVRLSSSNHHQLFVPEGFAHGFCALSERADVLYKCTDFYTPGDEYGILWNDPALGIEWPVDQETAIVSEKDARCPILADMPLEHLPEYR